MDERYVSALENNPNIDPDIKDRLIESFRSVFYMLGEYGFMRWVDMTDMPDRFKKLIVEEFNAEDLIIYSNSSGYYSSAPEIIKVRDKSSSSVPEILEHEDVHFLASKLAISNLGVFQGEGVTEYIKKLISILAEINSTHSSSYTYKENVDYIDFICQIVGNGIIKSYFDWKYGMLFEKRLSSYLTDANGDIEFGEYYDVYNNYKRMLDKINKYLHPRNKEEEIEARALREEVVKELYPKLKDIIVNIMVHSIRIKASNLEYYSGGIFQADKLKMDIARCIDVVDYTLVGKGRFDLNWVGRYSVCNYISRSDFEKRAIEAVLKESCIDSSIIPEVIDLYMKNRFSSGNDFVEESAPMLKEDRASILKKILDKKFPQGKKWGISEYFMTLCNIIEKMGITEEELQFVMDSIVVRYLPPDISPEVAKEILGNHLHFFSELYRKNQDSISNLYDIKFVKMSENQFIECRDHVLYYVKYDKDTGKFNYTLIPPDAETLYNNSKHEENITTFRTPGERVVEHTLTYSETFWKVYIDGKRCWPIRSVEDLGKSYLVEALLHPIKEKVDNGEYVTRLNDASEEGADTSIDGVEYSAIIPDQSSLIVNFKLFAQDLLEITKCIYRIDCSDVIEEAYTYLFEKVFHCVPSNFEKLVDLSRIIEEPLSKSMQDEILKCMVEANQKRKEHIDSLITINKVHFSSEEAKKRYQESIKTKQKKKERALLNQKIRAFVQIEAQSAIAVPNHNDSYDLSEENIFISGVKHSKREPSYSFPTAKQVDYNKFFELLKKQLEDIPKGKRKTFIRRTINDSTTMWYGGSVDYKKKIIARKKSLIGRLINIFNEYYNGTNPIDTSQTSDIEKELIELSNDTYNIVTQRRKGKVKGFESNAAEVTYHTVKAITENPGLSDDQKRLIINTLVANNNVLYQKDKTMKAFMKLALAGDNIPTEEDIKVVSELLDLYGEKIPD